MDCPGGYRPALEYNIRSKLLRDVTDPTEERDVVPPRCCCNATAGGRPSMLSTIGTGIWWNKRRAYGDTDSRYRRCASAYRVPNAKEDFPDPDTPVNTTNASLGMSRLTFLRLCSRAPRTWTKPLF